MAKLFDRLGKLFDSSGSASPEEESAEESGGVEAPSEQPAPPPRPAVTESVALSEVKGALLEVWKEWKGEFAPPPTLTLVEGTTAEDLLLDDATIARERVRIGVQLEQEAKRRVKAISDARKLAQNVAGKDQEPAPISMNATCQVLMTRDRMTAWLFLFPPVGPEGTFTPDLIGKALQDAKVTTGIDQTAVLNIFQEQPYFTLLPIAVGTAVIEGTNGSVEELYPREIPKEVKINEDGKADYRASTYVRMVDKGAVICNINLPVEGIAGVRVDGSVVEPKPVRAAKVPSGANTMVTEEGTALIATLEGNLEFQSDKFIVRPTLEIKGDVDYSTGNIDFRGDVHICGDVRENFVVRATGSVMVDGLVEAALIECGGDLVITRGVVGDNRALLKSRGVVRVKYLENCSVYAGQGVYADCIMSSQVFSDDSIEVVSGRGSVIGGAMTAAHRIKARMIGAQSGRKTELTLGVLPYVREELQNVEDDLHQLRKESQQLEKELYLLENSQGMEGSSARLAKAHMRKSVLAMKEQQIRKRRERLAPMSVDLSNCRLEADIVYPVTTLTVAEAIYVVSDTKRHCRVGFNDRTGELYEA
ncbi:MAG: DUF342 domain-containing protein [Clostridia bacterium]|nr:DUF342 domain-containing protein [Clostridia bacterium]